MANTAPTCVPRWSQHGKQIDASWDRILGGFGRILEAKMEPCWHPNRSNIDATCEKRFFEKSCSPCSGGLIFWVRGVQVGSKNRLKINQKRSSTWEGILASIFERFWWILGGKLGSKIKQKSIQKGIETVMKKRRSPKWDQTSMLTLKEAMFSNIISKILRDSGSKFGANIDEQLIQK